MGTLNNEEAVSDGLYECQSYEDMKPLHAAAKTGRHANYSV